MMYVCHLDTEITTRYVPFNQEKFTRRQFLLEKWQFHCQCRCCSDPSENGTYYSAIAHKCCKDEDGYLLPHVINKAEWICNKCSARDHTKTHMYLFKTKQPTSVGVKTLFFLGTDFDIFGRFGCKF